MTGYGDARRQTGDFRFVVEVRAVNNRYFKLACRTPEGFGSLESNIEKAVRRHISRGTVSVALRTEPSSSDGRYTIDSDLLRSYWRQLHDLAEKLHAPTPGDLGAVLQLPGAVVERQITTEVQELWPTIGEALEEALVRLQEFRTTEGASMRDELSGQCEAIAGELQSVSEAAPTVIENYRERITQRLEEILAAHDMQIEPGDVAREVGLYADRCDITEEITRLHSHLDQFATVMKAEDSQGRKLEFLSQEMFREVNTIGSKANNVEIAHCVVEMKAAVEKMREILQNVE